MIQIAPHQLWFTDPRGRWQIVKIWSYDTGTESVHVEAELGYGTEAVAVSVDELRGDLSILSNAIVEKTITIHKDGYVLMLGEVVIGAYASLKEAQRIARVNFPLFELSATPDDYHGWQETRKGVWKQYPKIAATDLPNLAIHKTIVYEK